ncbi:uncharacterized protein LOC135369111 [Ornithodoros turicata]|uniref:uncharacterized protein LOC135369111 n=1 Tax=Ornithodoros turicata TaxID=34597 RepID=UPI003138C1F5
MTPGPPRHLPPPPSTALRRRTTPWTCQTQKATPGPLRHLPPPPCALYVTHSVARPLGLARTPQPPQVPLLQLPPPPSIALRHPQHRTTPMDFPGHNSHPRSPAAAILHHPASPTALHNSHGPAPNPRACLTYKTSPATLDFATRRPLTDFFSFLSLSLPPSLLPTPFPAGETCRRC